MILSAVTGLSMVLLTSTGPGTGADPGAHMSTKQKLAIVQNYVTRATECVAHGVAADPRFARLPDLHDLGELIVQSVPSCAELMRAMIECYDDYFGAGAGEAFFSGPYLDVLPSAVAKLVEDAPR
jgi:hypothetical protein